MSEAVNNGEHADARVYLHSALDAQQNLDQLVAEAEEVLDVVSIALQTPAPGLRRRKSELQGLSLREIDCALKVRLARLFLDAQHFPDGEKWFQEAINTHSPIPSLVHGQFVDDEEVRKLEEMDQTFPEFARLLGKMTTESMNKSDPSYEQWAELETVESFADFCRHVGPNNPAYWQKVYEHLDVQYRPEFLDLATQQHGREPPNSSDVSLMDHDDFVEGFQQNSLQIELHKSSALSLMGSRHAPKRWRFIVTLFSWLAILLIPIGIGGFLIWDAWVSVLLLALALVVGKGVRKAA